MESLKIRPIVAWAFLLMLALLCRPGSAGGASVVRTDQDIYNQGEVIRVHFTNAPGNDSDWLCIVPAGSPDTDAGDYKYMPPGSDQGVLIFDPPPPGKYEARAYYNYRRNGYKVSGRYAFSVVGDPAREEALTRYADPVEPDSSLDASLPPPIPFAAPPELIVLPETYVYVVPDVSVDIFFHNGWWWRPWEGRWYRSLYYDRGWSHYGSAPKFYFDIDPGWRGYYRNHDWYGHRWSYERIPHQRLQRNWKRWQNDRHWEKRGTWGVRKFQPRPQQLRQELRQQRQQQYQHTTQTRRPQREPQVQQSPKQPQAHRPPRQPQVQQPQKQPPVERLQREPQVRQPQRQDYKKDQQPRHFQPQERSERR